MTSGPSDLGELEGFSDSARRAVAMAAEQARDLGHSHVGTEHLLLGLVANEDSEAATALSDAGVTLAAARHKVEEAVGGPQADVAAVQLTARAGRAVERAVRFSHHRRADAVTSAHLLMGVLDVEGRAGQVLRGLGVDMKALLAALEGPSETSDPESAPETPPAKAQVLPATCPACSTELDDELSFRTLMAHDDRGATREVVVFTCDACGTAIGIAPA